MCAKHSPDYRYLGHLLLAGAHGWCMKQASEKEMERKNSTSSLAPQGLDALHEEPEDHVGAPLFSPFDWDEPAKQL